MPYKDVEAQREYHRNYMRMRYQTDPVHREKQKIRVRNQQVKDRPKKCDRCDRRRKLEGHHPNYKKPNLRVWLCRPCHREKHPSVC